MSPRVILVKGVRLPLPSQVTGMASFAGDDADEDCKS